MRLSCLKGEWEGSGSPKVRKSGSPEEKAWDFGTTKKQVSNHNYYYFYRIKIIRSQSALRVDYKPPLLNGN